MKQIIKRSLMAVVALTALFSSIQAQAYDAPWNGWREDITGPGPEPEEDCQTGECGSPNDCNTGSPVYTARGSLVWHDADVRFPGLTRVGLKRTYNSFDFRAGMFGRGWMTAQESSIARTYKAVSQSSADGSPATATEFESMPVWLSSHGRRYKLQENANSCTPPPVFFFTFEKQADGSFKQVFEDSRSYSIYNDSGELLESYSDQSGSSTYYDYDGQDRLVRQYDSYGYTLNFVYNERGFVEQVSDQAGRIWSYSYDDYGNLVQVVDPDDNSRDYGYLLVDNSGYKQHLLNSVHDNLDEQQLSVAWSRITLYNKKAMRVASYTQRDGHRHDYSYAQTTYDSIPAVRVVKSSRQIESNAIVETQTFIADANRYWILQQSSSARGTILQRVFNNRGQLTERRDERGNTARFEYNTAGRTTRITHMAGSASERVTTISYLDNSNRVALINEYGLRETRFTYDADRRMLSRTLVDLESGKMRTWSYGYHPNSSDSQGNLLLGRLASVDGPQTGSEDRHSFFYNAQGQVSRVERPLGQLLGYSYNTAGQLLAATDANGVTTEISFDSRNRPLQIDRSGRSTSIEYTAQGLISKITDELERVISLTYNNHNQPLQISYPSADKVSYSYQYASSYTEATSRYSLADGAIVSSRISRHDPVTGLPEQNYLHSTAELAAQHQYNGLDDLMQTTLYGQYGNTTGVTTSTFKFLYDGEGRLKQIRDGLDGVTTLSHDVFDRITQVADANGGATLYSYTTWGELTHLFSPDSGSSTYDYDPAGNLAGKTDANGVQSGYSYDALGRLTGIDYPGFGLDITLTYDEGAFGKGRLTSVSDGSGSHSYQYDERGLLLQSSDTVAGSSFDVSYSHNDAGQLTGIGYPSGAQVSYSHDSAGRLSSVEYNNGNATEVLGDISWSGPNMAGYRQGNGVTTELVYDGSGRLIEKRYGSDNSLQLGLDRQGQIISQNWSRDGSSDSSGFLYDHLGRLSQDGSDSQAFSYDPAGNRLSRQGSGSGDSYSYDASSSRLNQIETAMIQRDAAGNRLDDGSRRYRYNAMNRLARMESDESQIQASYSYNYRGERVRKELAGVETADIRYVYGQDGELLGEYDSDGSTIREYIYLGAGAVKELIAQVEEDGSIITIHSDHLATPRLATAHDQTIVWRWNSDAFGTASADEDPDNDGSPVIVNHRFPGQHYDVESGLHYNLHRYYDPATGRYITSDPIGLAGGLNTYGYVGANPLKYSDPKGLFFWDALDVGFFVNSLYEYYQCSSSENALNLGLDAIGLLPLVPALGSIRRVDDATDAVMGIKTPYGVANQSSDAAALAARSQVEEGATIYRIGTTGKSHAAKPQFWSLEHPHSPDYAQKYGIPSNNVQNANFVEAANLKSGTPFVTRPAPSVGSNSGGGIEAVVPEGGAQLKWFSYGSP